MGRLYELLFGYMGPLSWKPRLPIFGSGPLFNFLDSDAALTNASAHIGWSLAIPLLARAVGGRKILWLAGPLWLFWSLVNEAYFHAPPAPGLGYSSEVRTDLVTRIIPCFIILLVDLWKHREELVTVAVKIEK